MRWLLVCLAVLAAIRSAHAAGREPLDIRNFHVVERGFFRSGRPTELGLRQLVARHGLKTIVNLEDDPGAIAREAARARALGITHISMPLHHRVMQDHKYTERIGSLLADPALRPILVHCAEGRDRTGMIVAIHRIKRRGWSLAQAEAEMHHRGFHTEFTFLSGHVKWEASQPR
jgi:protein tyrosine/serine phosphatase